MNEILATVLGVFIIGWFLGILMVSKTDIPNTTEFI